MDNIDVDSDIDTDVEVHVDTMTSPKYNRQFGRLPLSSLFGWGCLKYGPTASILAQGFVVNARQDQGTGVIAFRT